MKILRITDDSQLILDSENHSMNDLGWSESFLSYENELLDIVVNDL